jgi:chemotaxis protein methyltransferase CheR
VFRQQFSEVEDACSLAQAIVDTVREPLIVLDKDLRAIAASRSFYVKFATSPDDTRGRRFYELGNGGWDIPKLRLLLERIIPDHGAMDECEVEHDLPGTGKCVLLLSASIVVYEKGHKNILLSIEDVTLQRALQREKDDCCDRRTCCSMKSDYRQHYHVEGKVSGVGGDAPSSAGRPQKGDIGCSGTATSSCFGGHRVDGNAAISDHALRSADPCDDR